jgi:serine-type D-Ala-D-Ala carboxypeptidase (penicillin-binding protein 5/6)
MTRNLKFFFGALFLSMLMWWTFDLTAQGSEEFFLARELKRPEVLASHAAHAKLDQKLKDIYPLVSKNKKNLSLEATAAYSLLLKKDEATKVLFAKQSTQPLSIASLTKLMTALVATTSYPQYHQIKLTPEILAEEGESGQLREEDTFTVKDFLYLALIESSNDAAAALAEPMGRKQFIDQMNKQASALELEATWFSNPTGLDPDLPEDQGNYSSAKDMSQLAVYILRQYPQILDIISQQQFNLYDLNGGFHHTLENTNVLLGYPNWPAKILGGKTGFTPMAKETFILLVESPDGEGIIVNVILQTNNRFGDMKKLLQWILNSYQWNPQQ